MRIVLIGMKGCGKTTIGTLLAERLHIPFIDSDAEIEKIYQLTTGEALPFRQIFKQHGEAYFHALEISALKHIVQEFGQANVILACGGRTPLQEQNQALLAELGEIIFLNLEKTILLKRILAQGIPAFFRYPDDPERSLNELLSERLPVYKKLADRTLDIGAEAPEEVVHTILTEIGI